MVTGSKINSSMIFGYQLSQFMSDKFPALVTNECESFSITWKDVIFHDVARDAAGRHGSGRVG